MNSTIACCILTYKHPDIINTYLDYCLEMYNENGVDIYIYDSSPEDDTKNVVEKYMSNDHGLYYIRIDSSVHPDVKLNMAFKQDGFEKKYQYILPIKDRSLYLENTWKIVQEYAKEDPDLIYLEVCKHPDKYRYPMKRQYDDAKEFFSDYGWEVTSLETCLVNTKILDLLNWEEIEKTYNVGIDNSFGQPITVFVALSQIEKPDIRVLFEKEANQHGITGVTSGWRNQIFDVWARQWPTAIRSLPSIYDDFKEKVIFDQTDIRALFGWATYMASLREQNVLNEEVWEWLRPIWSTLSSIPVEEMDCIVANDFMGAVKLMYNRLDICLENEDYKGIWKIFDQYEDMAPGDLMVALYAGLYIDECERNKGISNGIFSEVYSSQEYLNRYNSMVELIKKFETDITKEEGIAVYKRLQRLHLTGESLNFIITAYCENKDAVINNLESLWD